jgi:translation initiation factor IF-2
MQARLLREAEEARLAALEAANRREQEERQRAMEEERRRAEENRKAEEAPAAAAEPPSPNPWPGSSPVKPRPLHGCSAAARKRAAPAPSANTAVRRPHPRRAALPGRSAQAARTAEARPRDKNAVDRRQAGKLTVTR